jgi:hypothetical protein
MALLTPTPPPEVTTAFQEGLTTLLDGPNRGSAGQITYQHYLGGPPAIPSQADVGFVSGAPPPGHDPQQVFVLGLSDLVRQPGTAAARQDSWRLFAGNTQGKTCMGRVVQRSPGGWKLTSCLWGDQVWSALLASQAIATLAAALPADYELRVLRIPGINLEAFWLVAQPPASGDLVVPFQANQSILSLGRSGTIELGTFLSVVGPMVIKRMLAPKSAIS